MKTKPNDGGAAFPLLQHYADASGAVADVQVTTKGMTLRDWFAGMALKGMCPNPEIGETWESLAADAYDAADAMLNERAK
jgi:hypothetical protein